MWLFHTTECRTKFVETHSEYDQIDSEAGYDWPFNRLPAILRSAETRNGEGDRFDVLADVDRAYEEKHWPIDPPIPWMPSSTEWSRQA